ncbi:MAG: DNA polymerase III subunit delta [Candidatus Kapaibacterium sp.]|nr:DNA polymerase III subunit delta [Bacteroidota bacterium]
MMLDSVNNVIRSGKFPPILFLFGEEEFLVEEAYQQVLDAIIKSGISDFNVDITDGEDVTPERLVQLAGSFPMMGDKRLVVVKRFEKVVSGRRTKNMEKSSPLASYISNPSPSTIVILLCSDQRAVAEELKGIAALLNNPKQKEKAAGKVAKLKFPYNLLIQHADWVEYPKLYERELPSWIAKRVKTMGREITPDACEYIVAQVGSSLRDIANEIEKIITFVNDKKRITADDVMALVGAHRLYNVFELQKAIGERQLTKSLDIVHNMLRNDRQELLIISLLARYFVSIWKLIEASRQSNNSYEIAKAIGVSSFFVPEYLAVLNRYTPQEIENAFFALHETDRKLKTSSGDTLMLLQQMIINIVAPEELAVRK